MLTVSSSSSESLTPAGYIVGSSSQRTVSPTSPTEGVGRRQAAEILGTQLQKSALQGMSAHRDFSAVPGSDFRRRLSGKLELQLPKQEQLILLWLRITGQDDHPIVRRGQFDIDHLHGGEFFEHDPRRQSRRQR